MIARRACAQLRDQLGVAAGFEVVLDPPLEAGQAQLFEPGDLTLGERARGELGERRPAQSASASCNATRGLLWIARDQGPAAILEASLEVLGIELARAHAKLVTPRRRHQQRSRSRPGLG